jgi:hypothetical protein
MERTQEWLETKLNNIWESLFPEVKRENSVVIRFSGKSKYRLGYIKLKKETTFIVLNSLFQSSLVPEYVIDTTVAHELVHYMHGFNSPLPQKYRYPHQGGIVTKELIKRGFANSLKLEKEWIKKDWLKVHRKLTN